MPLKLIVSNLDQVEEAYRPLYKAVDGHPDEFALDVEDAVPKGRLDEFRVTNRKLNEDLETWKKKYKDVDPEEFRRRGSEIEKLNEQITNKQTKGEKEYQQQMAQMAATHKGEKESLIGQLREKDSVISRMMIEDNVTRLAAAAKALGPAITDVVNRAKSVFRMEEGVVTAYRPTGEKWFSTETGNVLSIEEWIKLLPRECPHFFPANEGTRSVQSVNGVNGTPPSRTGTKNPWQQQSWNRTEQAKLMKSNPTLAKQLADDAGVKIPGFNV